MYTIPTIIVAEKSAERKYNTKLQSAINVTNIKF